MASSEAPRPWRQAFVRCASAALTLVAATLLATLRPINVIRCDPTRDCRIERWIGGVHFLYADELRNVRQVTLESHTESSYSRSSGHSSIRRARVILHDKPGTSTISTDSISYAVGTGNERMQKDLERFLAAPTPEGYLAWQGEAALILLCAFLAALGLGFLVSALRQVLTRRHLP